jgi:hypothetical protein
MTTFDNVDKLDLIKAVVEGGLQVHDNDIMNIEIALTGQQRT